jgi:hypothetical protein
MENSGWWDPISIRSEKRRQSGWESNRGGEELRLAEFGAWDDGAEGMEPNDRREVPVVGRHESSVVELGFLIPLEPEQERPGRR